MLSIAYASNHVAAAQDLVFKINDVFLFPLIALLSAVAFVVFLYGAFEYVRNSASQEGRQTGQRHLLYGVIGLLVMFSAYTILQIAAGTFGLSVDQNESATFTQPGPGDPNFVAPPPVTNPNVGTQPGPGQPGFVPPSPTTNPTVDTQPGPGDPNFVAPPPVTNPNVGTQPGPGQPGFVPPSPTTNPTVDTQPGPGDPNFVPPDQIQSPDVASDNPGGSFGSGIEEGSLGTVPQQTTGNGFDTSNPNTLTQPEQDSAVVPDGLINPNPNPEDTTVDTSSENPRYPVIDTWSNQTKTISCNNEMGCTGAIQSCTGADHNGVYSGVIGYDDDYGEYILCQP